MSTLVTDTLKVKGDLAMPVAYAKDVHVDYDDTDLETALEPATDTKLGRIKIGDNMDISTDGTLSITNRVDIAAEAPIDGTLTWIDDTIESKTAEPQGTVDNIKVSNEPNNWLSIQEDGLFAYHGHTVRPEPVWQYYVDGIEYFGGYPIALKKTISFYVSATGDDVYGDGTAANPRKTLGALPRNLNGYGVNIYVSGNYYAIKQDFNVNGFFGGYINIYMQSNPTFWRMQFYNCSARVYVRNAFTSSIVGYTGATGWTQAIYVGGCDTVYFTSDNTTTEGTAVTVTANGTGTFTSPNGVTTNRWRGILVECSNFYTDSRIKFTVKSGYQGLIVHNGSRAGVDRFYADSCTYGLVCGYSKCSGSTYSASSTSTAYSTYGGGRYYQGAQTSVGRY